MSRKIFLENPIINNLEGGCILCILPETKSGGLQKRMEKELISFTRGGKRKS